MMSGAHGDGPLDESQLRKNEAVPGDEAHIAFSDVGENNGPGGAFAAAPPEPSEPSESSEPPEPSEPSEPPEPPAPPAPPEPQEPPEPSGQRHHDPATQADTVSGGPPEPPDDSPNT